MKKNIPIKSLGDEMFISKRMHKCFACGRSFPKGSTLHVQRYGCIGVKLKKQIHINVYTCPTCEILLNDIDGKYMGFDDGYGEFKPNCVAKYIKQETSFLTPEELLDDWKTFNEDIEKISEEKD